MNPPTSAQAGWHELRQGLCAGRAHARRQLLATVTTLVSYTRRYLAPEDRAALAVRIAARLAARVRSQSIRSPEDLLRDLDAELALDPAPSAALLVRLRDSLAGLPEAQQRALSASYDGGSFDAHARRDALLALRGHLALDTG